MIRTGEHQGTICLCGDKVAVMHAECVAVWDGNNHDGFAESLIPA